MFSLLVDLSEVSVYLKVYVFFPDLSGLLSVAVVVEGVADRGAVVTGFFPLPYAIRATVAVSVFCTCKERAGIGPNIDSYATQLTIIGWTA